MLGFGGRSRWGVKTPCDSPGVLPNLLIGSGGFQKPSSWLSEGVGGVFTIHTEIGEMTCVPLHIPRTTMSSWLAGTGGYSLGPLPRNVCRNAWETVVL